MYKRGVHLFQGRLLLLQEPRVVSDTLARKAGHGWLWVPCAAPGNLCVLGDIPGPFQPYSGQMILTS